MKKKVLRGIVIVGVLITLISCVFITDYVGEHNDMKSTIKTSKDYKNEVDMLREKLENSNSDNEMLLKTIDSLQNIRKRKFDHVYNRFKIYNKDVDSSTVNKFLDVANYFSLDSSDVQYDMFISQICVESRAMQHYPDGNLVVSSGSAVGISQITPRTAYFYLRRAHNAKDSAIFSDLEAMNYDFVKGKKRFNLAMRTKVIYWLSNETNNLILWGYIIKCNLIETNFDVEECLIAYADGNGGLRKYKRSGARTENHFYIKYIYNKNARFERKGV